MPMMDFNTVSTPWGLKGEVDPDTAMGLQNLERKRMLANVLMQQGLHAPQGKMVGRFYVPPSPLEHLANLAKVGVSAYANSSLDDQRSAMMKALDDQRVQALDQYRTLREGLPAQGPGVPQLKSEAERQQYEQDLAATAAPVPYPSGMPPPSPPLSGDMQTQYLDAAIPQRAVAPIPYEGAVPLQQTAEQNAVQRVAEAYARRSPGLYTEGPTPRTMSNPEQINAFLAEQLMSRNPAVQRWAGSLLTMQKDQADKDAQREFLQREKALDRANRLETDRGRLDQALMLGLITKEQRDQLFALQQQKSKEESALKREELDIRRTQLEQGKVPSGYRRTDDNRLEAIPGGPADLKQQGVFNADTAMLQSTNAAMDRLAASANELLRHPGLGGITGVRGKVPDIPGTDAANARALVNKLKSQVGFTVMQELRNNSKSGSTGLGALSDAEGKRLESNLAALDSTQGIEQMKSELQKLIDYTESAKGRFMESFNLKHKSQAAPSAPSGQQTPVKISTDDDYDKLPSGTIFLDPEGKQRRKP